MDNATIMEEREELMLVPGSNPTRRPAHFLSSSFLSPTAPSFAIFRPVNKRVKVSFEGWKNPLQGWNEWVDLMKLVHHSTWKEAGIYNAIIASTYEVRPDTNLILALAQRWCHETNSFVFPWGEATVSLEDVFILGGFSVLGESVLSQGDVLGFDEIDEKLNEVRAVMNRSKDKKVLQVKWMKKFMGSGSKVEHEAFLLLWLSRHVFPYATDVVGRHLHEIAIKLARGTRLALAPAVLAYIYCDLNSLKNSSEEISIEKSLNLWSLVHLVQVWAWERLPTLRPQPNFGGEGAPRMSRWNRIEKNSLTFENVDLAIETAAENFVWRPYTISEEFKFYPEKDELVSVSSTMHVDYKTFAQIVRYSQIFGLDCVEPYFPHRVSLQFGLDQDIPGKVVYDETTPEAAWRNYSRPIGDEELHIPSRVFQSAVTVRYLEWWRHSFSVRERENIVNDSARLKLRSSKRFKGIVKDTAAMKGKKVDGGKHVLAATESGSKKKNQGLQIIDLDDDGSSPEPTEVSENLIVRRDEVGPGHPQEGEVCNDQNEGEETKEARLMRLRKMPLEYRINRLEELMAQLKNKKVADVGSPGI